MRVPFPSSSPAAQNVTYINDPVNTVAAAVGGTAIGAVVIASMVALAQSMKTRGEDAKKAEGAEEEAEEGEAEGNTTVRIRLGEGMSYLCVNTSDLDDVVRLLAQFQKQFRVLTSNTSPSL